VGSSEPGVVVTPYLFTALVIIAVIMTFIWKLLPNVKCLLKKKGISSNIDTSFAFQPALRTIYAARRNVYNELYESQNGRGIVDDQFITPLVRLELQNVSAPWFACNNARFAPCKLNTIIGASGCGKSTFLDLLRGNIPTGKLGGLVYAKLKGQKEIVLEIDKIQQHTQWPAFEALKKIRGYVPQDDVVYGDLTVFENLWYSALIRLRNKDVDVDHVVHYVIEQLGMTAMAHKIVGTVERRGISGGQRKRVNIGMEVVTLPSLLIMDEPTSGLDAHGSQQLVEFCKVLTHMNITVVAVVHQPRYSSFALFDQVTLLSKHGTIFEGPATSSLVYFTKALSFDINKNDNPADVIMDILSGSKGMSSQELVIAWREGTGQHWLTNARTQYPLHQDILDMGVCYDANTRTIVDELLLTTKDNVDVIEFLGRIGLTVAPHEAQEYNIIFPHNIHVKEFKRIMQEVCSAAAISNGYDNVVDRIKLFKNLPERIRQQHGSVNPARSLFLVHKFAKRLLGRRLQEQEERKDYKANRFAVLFHEELLLASMTCKAFYKYRLGFHQGDNNMNKPLSMGILNNNLVTIIRRKMIMMYRSPWPIQLFVPICAAFIVGHIQGFTSELRQYPNNIVSALVCMGVLSMITHVRSLTMDKVTIRREAEGNVGLLPFFIAYNITDLIWVFLLPLCFMIPFYYLTFPATSFGTYLGVGFMICWWTSGCAYIVSSLPLAMHWATLISVFVSVILGAFLQGLNPSIHESHRTFQGAIIHTSFNRWAMEILTLKEFMKHENQHANTVWSAMDNIGLCGLKGNLFDDLDSTRPSLKQVLRLTDLLQSSVSEQCDKYVQDAYLWLFGYGCLFRLVALGVFYYNLHPIWARFHWSLFKK
jgi:ABC-type multidrug transport system ATPase subunit